MHHLSYNISADHIQSTEVYFPRDYIEKIRQKNTYEQSLVGRYLVSKIVEENWGISDFLPRVDEEGRPVSASPHPLPFGEPLPEGEGTIYWSISHSGGHVFVGVSENPIGVDIEAIRPRDESLFGTFSDQEWDILGDMNWELFYILWSAKEALVKKYLGGVDEIGKWRLIGIERISDGVKKLSFSDGTIVEVVSSEVVDGVVRSWSV